MTRKSDGIVAGYDGSPGAERALRWAVREAWERSTVLTVCLAWAPEYLTLLDEASVSDLAQRKGVTLRTAAFMKAISRVVRAKILGGI